MDRRLTLALTAAIVLAIVGAAAPAAHADYRYEAGWGRAGSGPARFGRSLRDVNLYRLFRGPGGLAFDRGGNIWVADTENDRLQRFSPKGRYLGSIGHKGIAPGGFLHPQGIATDRAGTLFIAQNGNDRVDVFTPRGRLRRIFHVSGRLRTRFGLSRGGAPGQLHSPYGIAPGPHGIFYVADQLNGRVNRYTHRGRQRGHIGAFGTGPGQFLAPYGVAVDRAGDVYVSDRELNRVQKFSQAGQLLLSWGETGSGAGEFVSPTGLAIDRLGDVYVADTINLRVQKFSPTGAFMTQFGRGLLRSPNYILVDNRNCGVYVSDFRRVLKFADPGGC